MKFTHTHMYTHTHTHTCICVADQIGNVTTVKQENVESDLKITSIAFCSSSTRSASYHKTKTIAGSYKAVQYARNTDRNIIN